VVIQELVSVGFIYKKKEKEKTHIGVGAKRGLWNGCGGGGLDSNSFILGLPYLLFFYFPSSFRYGTGFYSYGKY
jgi:hypothetical protein